MLSAVQPTNQLHLGNYLGAIKNWVELQAQYDCIFFAVDLHSITTRQDPKVLRENTYSTIASYLAAGVNPDHCTLFAQSHVSEHAELGWALTCFTGMGELSRMTQFKEKSAKHEENIPTGIFVYPALMAADILLYKTHLVPVGADQKQHLELARDLAERLNKFFAKEVFVMPDVYHPKVGARIMSLQKPTSKMSKSDGDPTATIFLSDTDDQIIKKFKKSMTDSHPTVQEGEVSEGVKNLFSIQASHTGKAIESIHQSYVGRQYGYLKLETAEIVVSAVKPIREKTENYLKDLKHLDALLKAGANKARARASKTLHEVYEGLGFLPR